MAKMIASASNSATGLQHLGIPAAQRLVAEFTRLLNDVLAITNREQNRLVSINECTFTDGAAVGKIDITGGVEAIPIDYTVNGEHYKKAPADPVWDFTAEVDTAAGKYRAYYLLLDAAGTATFVAVTTTGTDAATAAAAIAALLAAGEATIPADKAVVGTFIAGPSTDMSADAIVAKANAEMHYGFHAGLRYVPLAGTLAS